MPEWKSDIRKRLANLKLEPARENEIVEELAGHLEDRYREMLARGASHEEATRSALADLSDTQLLARELSRVERPARKEPVVLGTRRKNMIGNLWHDLRYGLRILVKSPIFTAVAVLTLTLGIGANTMIFSLANALLFRPLPAVQEPDQLTYLSGSYSYPDYEYFRDRNEVFSGLLAQGGTTSLNLNTGGEPELVVGELVTANFFSVLGVTPAMGRTFMPEEDRQPGAHPVAVIGYGFWQRRFGSDGDIVGKTVQLNGLSFTIIGVMPRTFIGDEVGKQRDLWVPMMMQARLAPSSGSHGVVSREGSDPNSDDAELMTGYNVVASRYCETMGIALVQGRDFSDTDRKDTRAVAIVNQTLAGRLWPDENPIGKRLLVGGPKGNPVEVIGLTRDGKYESLGERPQPFLYRPVTQDYQSAMTLVARTEGDPRALLSAAEEQVRALDRNLAVFPAETMAAYVRASLAPARLGAMLLGIFGLLGLGLAAVGVFSVVAYSVSQRTREIGIRMALGAQPGDVTRLVLKEGMTPVGIGISLGLGAGLALAQLVASLLYGVSATDPMTFVSVTLLLAAVAFLACYVPARRATKVDPLATLRCE